MRLASLARRSVAVVAATALVSAGGIVTGLSSGVAHATEVYGVSPKFPINAGTTTFTISGATFKPSAATSVTLHKVVAAANQQDVSGAVGDNSASCLPPTDCGGTLTFSADLTNAAPGDYDVIVTGPPALPAEPSGESDTCPACLTVLASGNPSLATVARYTADRQLTLSGSNLSTGSQVEFLQTDTNGVATVPDPAISFDARTTDSNGSIPGNVSASILRGTYTATPSAMPGLHKIRVRTTDAQQSNLIDFYQPQINTISPAALGQGASQVPVTVTGTGFNSSSTFGIQSANTTTPDIAVLGAPVVTPTSITANVSVTPTSAAGSRLVTVRGADGGIATATSLFAVDAGPKITGISPNRRGQGSSSDITVTGSGFNNGSVFDFGDGTTSTTKTVNPNGNSAIVGVAVGPTAKIGGHDVKVTNADFGNSALASGLAVTVAPVVTALTPASASPGTGPFNVLLDGSGFATSGGVSLALLPSTGITVGPVNVVNDHQLQTTITTAGNAAAGPRDVVVTNLGDGGSSTCTSCFGINSLAVAPQASTNNVVKTLTLTPAAGSPLGNNTTVRIFLPGFPAYQAPINGSNVAYDATSGKATVDVDLRNVATGAYSVEATTGSSVLTCTACLTVAAPSNPVVTAIAPATAGQGATGRAVTITGSNFTPGETVTFSDAGVTSSDVQYISPTKLTAVVAVAPTAPVGARNVTVTNIGDKKAGALANGFTVAAAPATTSITPSTIGQGGTTEVTLTGTGYAAGAVADFGPGTTNQLKDAAGVPTKLVYTVVVASDADTTTPRSVKVTNADGGSSALANALTITPAPIITSISPAAAKPGDTKTGVTFSGTGFQSSTEGTGDKAVTTFPTITIGNATVTVTSVGQDGTSLVADIKVDPAAASGKRTVFITNPDDGKSSLTNGFAVASVPVAPINVAVPSTGDASAVITWDFPTAAGSDGGSPLTGFVVDDGDTTTDNAKTVAADVRTVSLTGMTNGKTYAFTVKALNDVGTGPAGTATASLVARPLPPTTVTAVPGDGRATVTFSGANKQGREISGYKVQVKGTPSTAVVVPGTQNFAIVTGLTNGSAYQFEVAATNDPAPTGADTRSYGSFSSPSAAVVPKFATALSSTPRPSRITAGARATVSGVLRRTASGAGIASARILLTFTPDIGASVSRTTTTNASGGWSYVFAPTYNTIVRARFAGSPNEAGVNAAGFKEAVGTRITVSSPANGATTAANSTLLVRGATTPNKANRTIGLYYGNRLIGRATVASNGTYAFKVKLGRGAYTLHVGIGATPGNVASNSANFVVRRR